MGDLVSHNLQPTPLQFGNRQVATSTARRFLVFGYSRNTATTNMGVPAFLTAPRRVRRMKVRHGSGRGNGNTLRYRLLINGDDTPLFVDIPSTTAGVVEKALPMDQMIDIPPDAQLDVVVDKPDGSIGQSPLDCTATVELL